ncbi:hypothetical protein [Archangium sp.]|jgi:hypothetical protein|uniref:hypothetical protein n=1 Tax=Archangium sp. TaxID=1872627 RepID=UPI002ED9629A
MSESRKSSPQEDSKVGKKARSAGEMSPELREALEKLRELMTQSDTQDAATQYRIGCVVCDVQDAPGKYGAGSVKRLARELGRNETSLYHRAQVARTWPPDEYNALLARKSSKGLPLSFYHLVLLASVEDRNARERLIEEALKKDVSVNTMRRLVKTQRTPAGGAGDEVPAYRVLTNLVSQSERMFRETELVEKALTELKGGATPEVMALVKKAAEVQRAVGKACMEIAERLGAACGGIVGSSQQPDDSGNVSEISPMPPSAQAHVAHEGASRGRAPGTSTWTGPGA